MRCSFFFFSFVSVIQKIRPPADESKHSLQLGTLVSLRLIVVAQTHMHRLSGTVSLFGITKEANTHHQTAC